MTDQPITACLFGASGGIGGALLDRLVADPSIGCIHAGARTPLAPRAKVQPFPFALDDEASLAQAAQIIKGGDAPRLILIATGILHEGSIRPEKSWRMQQADHYARMFAINATGPALIGKHMLPLLPRSGRAVFAVLSARVGSIEDNRLGGWHAYRASKAALNQIVRTFSTELARHNPDALAVTLHPGTVETALSAPFRSGAPRLFTPDQSAGHLLKVLSGLSPKDSGGLFAWDGQRIAF